MFTGSPSAADTATRSHANAVWHPEIREEVDAWRVDVATAPDLEAALVALEAAELDRDNRARRAASWWADGLAGAGCRR